LRTNRLQSNIFAISIPTISFRDSDRSVGGEQSIVIPSVAEGSLTGNFSTMPDGFARNDVFYHILLARTSLQEFIE